MSDETKGTSYESPLFQCDNALSRCRIWRDPEYGWGTSGDTGAMACYLADLIGSERADHAAKVRELEAEIRDLKSTASVVQVAMECGARLYEHCQSQLTAANERAERAERELTRLRGDDLTRADLLVLANECEPPADLFDSDAEGR